MIDKEKFEEEALAEFIERTSIPKERIDQYERVNRVELQAYGETYEFKDPGLAVLFKSNSPEGLCPMLYFPKKQSVPVLSHSETSGLIYVYFGGEKYEITKFAIEAVEAIKALEQEPTTKNDLGVDCTSRHFQEIVVEYPPAKLCTYPEYRDRPYFSIKYEENGEHIIGYGTYNPEVLSKYLRDYFMPSVTPQEPFINKPCVSEKVCEHDKNVVLDKIRAEIDGIEINGQVDEYTSFIRTGEQVKQLALNIIDKYKEDKEKEE